MPVQNQLAMTEASQLNKSRRDVSTNSPSAELALLARALWRVGYRDDVRGHISYRQPDGSILVNAYGLRWSELTAGDIVRIDGAGQMVSSDQGLRPTPAIRIHVALHRLRPDIRVVLHHHPDYGTVWAGANRIPPAYDQNSAYVDPRLTLLLNEYGGSFNDAAVAERIAEEIGDADFVFLGNHGVIVMASDIWQAYWRAYCLEWRCRLAWQIACMGGGTPMNDSAQQKLRDMVRDFNNTMVWEAAVREELRLDPSVLLTNQ
jgi:L-fuculose-phosphate aldolase